MRVLALVVGVLCCFGVVLDAFQTIILPRRPSGRLRITRLFYVMTWEPLVRVADRMKNHRLREQIYSIYGPLSLLLLLVLWAVLLILGFGLIYFSMHAPFADPMSSSGSPLEQLRTDVYVSGTTLVTLGLGDVTPHSLLARVLVVVECGSGLAFVALVIGYVPVIYQAFSRREVSVAMLDGRAGSPPTATELLRRHGYEGGEVELIALLGEWERWSAEILESHISYPLLCYYRSQHDNQSWLSALTAVLDACALLITTIEGPASRQAQLTFAMARHALIDLGHVFHVEERARSAAVTTAESSQRLSPQVFARLCEALGEIHMRLCGDPESLKRLAAIRQLYEPHALALAEYLKMPLPLWVAEPKKADSWKTIAQLRASTSDDALQGIQRHVSDRSAATHLHDEEHGYRQ